MMKKLVLSLSTAFCPLAKALSTLFPLLCFAQTDNVYSYNTLDDNTSYVGTYSPVCTPIAYGADGTIYATGLYDKIVMIGDDILEPVATSTYLSAVDNASGKRKWTVGIMGASRITAVTQAGGAVFVAGIFADDITLGSEDSETVDYSGTPLSHDMVNGFVAKYSLEGNLQASQVIIPHRIAKYSESEYESDLMVCPTAIAAFGGKLYLSMTFLGGYDVASLSVDGNVKSSFGYWDSKCADVIAFSAADLSGAECIYDLRNSEDINTNGYAPSSISLTSTANGLYIGAFTSQNCKETLLSAESSSFEAGSTEAGTYYLAIHALDNDGKDRSCTLSAVSDRTYINNILRKMVVNDDKIYLAGCISTPLPMDNTLVPDLWCDEFASQISLSDFSIDWSCITGAKRDDMATTNEKYRQSTDAALSEGKFIVIGSTNFQCGAQGSMSDFSSYYCLGIAGTSTSLALSAKTDTGSKLTVNGQGTGINAVQKFNSSKVSEYYNLAGQKVGEGFKGTLYIQQNKKILSTHNP